MPEVATLRVQRAEWRWPGGLGAFDSRRWSSRAAWHLARAHAAPSELVALLEIQAAVHISGAGVDDCASVVIVPPPPCDGTRLPGKARGGNPKIRPPNTVQS